MQNLALLKMNKDHNQKVFIMQSIQKKSWMKSSSNNLNKSLFPDTISPSIIEDIYHYYVCIFLFHMIANYL